MKLKAIVNKSYYVTNGYIDSLDSVNILEGYIQYNLPFLQQFKGIIIATTYKNQDFNLINANKQLWIKYFPECILIDIKENRGHSFGIADSENAIIDYCKENNIDWICKSSNDVIIQDNILNKKIEKADFYYFNGISYSDLSLNDFNYEKMFENHFYPQTNFYFINTSKIDFLYDKQYVDKTYQYRLNIPNYNNKIWEYIPEWSCELFLKKCVERNKLIKHYLLDLKTHNRLCEVINLYKTGDPSHKNILIEGICHFQYPEQKIIEI